MRKLWMDILWLLVLFALIVVMGTLLIGGDILLYLAPRMVPMVWFGLSGLVVLLIYQLALIAQSLFQRDWLCGGRVGVVLFLVPVILFITVMPNQSTPGSLPNQKVKMMNLPAESVPEITPAQEDGYEQGEQGTVELIQTNGTGGLMPCVIENETTFFDPSADYFSEYLYSALEDLTGKTITVYGFVYTEDAFPENTIVVSRMMIACCAADASIVGFYVQLEESADLQLNEWIRVTGTIRSINLEYYGDFYDFPIMTDGLIVHCDAPDVEDAYIYP